MYDRDTERAIAAVAITGDARTEKWFNAICAAYANRGTDWDALKAELRATARDFDSSFDDTLVEAFLRAVEELGDPLRRIADLDRIGIVELARAYPALRARRADSGSDVTALTWLTPAQRAKLEEALGDGWPAVLTAALDDKYPPWRGATPDGLRGFVDAWSDHIIASARRAPARPPDAGSMAWVTPAQRNKMERALGGIWPEFVQATLQREYPVWRSAREADLRKFLDDWGDHIIAEHVPPAPPPPELTRELTAEPTAGLHAGPAAGHRAGHIPPAPPPPDLTPEPTAGLRAGPAAGHRGMPVGARTGAPGAGERPEADRPGTPVEPATEDGGLPPGLDLDVLRSIAQKFESGTDLSPAEADALEVLAQLPGVEFVVEDLPA